MGELLKLAAQPSEHQRSLWWQYIAIEEPVMTGTGTYVWMGWCPLCDKMKSEHMITARFDFRRGIMYCENGEGGRACFDKRSISLNNLLVRMGESGQR